MTHITMLTHPGNTRKYPVHNRCFEYCWLSGATMFNWYLVFLRRR